LLSACYTNRAKAAAPEAETKTAQIRRAKRPNYFILQYSIS